MCCRKGAYLNQAEQYFLELCRDYWKKPEADPACRNLILVIQKRKNAWFRGHSARTRHFLFYIVF